MTQLQGFNVRKANDTDILKVMQINQETLPENYPEFFFRDLLNKYPEAFFVAESEDTLIGYIMCRMEGGISNFGISWVRKGHIVSVTVLPRYRRQGVGTELISQSIIAMKESYDAKEVILEVRVSNAAAIARSARRFRRARGTSLAYSVDSGQAVCPNRCTRRDRREP